MANKVEDLIEYQEMKELKSRLERLPKVFHTMLAQEMVDQLCWCGPVTREWLEDVIKGYERIERHA